MPQRVAGRLECSTSLDFTLDDCSVERVSCDVDSRLLAGGVVCSRTSEFSWGKNFFLLF